MTFADTGAGYFYIDDGSALNDVSGHAGVKVLDTVPVQSGQDLLDKYVKVTGISSCYQPGRNMFRLIRATSVVIFVQ